MKNYSGQPSTKPNISIAWGCRWDCKSVWCLLRLTTSKKINDINICGNGTMIHCGSKNQIQKPMHKVKTFDLGCVTVQQNALQKTLYFILLILLTTFSTRLAWNINIEFICAVAPPTHLGHARALWGKILGSRMVLRGFVFFLQKSSHIHKPLHCDPHSQKSTCNEDNTIVEWNVKANIRGDFY